MWIEQDNKPCLNDRSCAIVERWCRPVNGGQPDLNFGAVAIVHSKRLNEAPVFVFDVADLAEVG